MAEAADRRVAHHLRQVGEQPALCAAAGRQPLQRFLLAHRTDPARYALAARLVPEELRDAARDVDEVGTGRERHHHAGAERGAGGARVLEGQRQVEMLRPDEAAGGAAEQDGARLAAGGAAGQRQQFAQRGAECHLVDAGCGPPRRNRENSLGPVDWSVPMAA